MFKFTASPENWLTAIELKKWGFNNNKRNKKKWDSEIGLGSIVLLHSVEKCIFLEGNVPSILGFGIIGKKKFIKKQLWWIDEIRENKNHWPYILSFEKLFLFSNLKKINFDISVDKKRPGQVIKDIKVLTSPALSLISLNKKAQEINPQCKDFPVMGSCSRVNETFFKVIMLEKKQLFEI